MKKQLTKLLMLLGVFLFLGAGSASAWVTYFRDGSGNSGTPHIWAWTGGNNEFSTSFENAPSMLKLGTYDDKNLWFYISPNSNVPSNVMFWVSNKDNSTNDFSFSTDGKFFYDWNGNTNNKGPFGTSKWKVNLTGQYNNWNPNRQDIPSGSTTVTWKNVALNSNGGDFQVWFEIDGLGTYYFSSGGNVSTSGATLSSRGDNSKFTGTANKAYDVTLDLSTCKISFKESATKDAFYIVGYDVDGNRNWGNTTAELTSQGNGIYTWTGDRLGTGFKITDDVNWNGQYNIGQSGDPIVIGKPYKYNNNSGSSNFGFRNYTYILNPTVTLDTNQGTVTVTGDPQGKGTNVYIVNSSDDYAKNDPFEMTEHNDNEYKLTVELTPGTYKFKVYYNYGLRGHRNNLSNGGKNGDDYIFDKPEESSGIDYQVVVTKKQLYTFYYKKHYDYDGGAYTSLYAAPVNDPSLNYNKEWPEKMYLYGNIQKGSWVKSNYAELEKVGDGIYYNNSVEIIGRWNDYDYTWGKNGDGTDREKWGSTIGVNYVALYPEINTKSNFAKTEGNVWKFGSYEPENNFDRSVNRKVWDYEYNKPINMVWQKEGQVNNFVVKDGTYSVRVDLNDGTVTFGPPTEDEEKEREEHTYRWYYGDDDNDSNADATRLHHELEENGMPIYEHTFTLSKQHKNVVQVGCANNTTHPAARQVGYTVWYKAPGTKNSKRRQVNASDYQTQGLTVTYQKVTTNEATGEKTYGSIYTTPDYKDGTETNDLGHYTVIGSEDYNDNHLLVLNKLGEYYIKADLADPINAKDLDDQDIYPSALIAYSIGSVTPNIGDTNNNQGDVAGKTITQAFNPEEDNTFESILSFDYDLVYGKDFTVSVTAGSENGTWASSTNTGDALKSDYQTAFNGFGTLYDQFTKLGGINAKLDGYYDEKDVNASASEGTENNGIYEYDIIVPVVCSGIYELTISGVEGSEYDVETANRTILIYPNLLGTFGKAGLTIGDIVSNTDKGFNIDGYTFELQDGNSTPLINYADNEDNKATAAVLAKSVAYSPGTYFASSFSVTIDEDSYSNKVKRAAAGTGENYFTPINLTPLANNDDITVTATISKNGTTATQKFQVAKSSSFVGSTTEVDSIEAVEEGEAVYFNLQGVKVQNPEHGIYVKVQNGKASKVVL